MLQQVKHSKSMPSYLSSIQMVDLGRAIHGRIKDVIDPLVEANPHYQAVSLTLAQLQIAVEQLDTAHRHRKFKSERSLVGVGGHDGLSDKFTLSKLKRKAYVQRKVLMQRLRYVLNWKLDEAEQEGDESLLAAATALNERVNIRIDDFEKANYRVSTNQFRYFIEEMEADNEALDALPVLDLTKVYGDIKAAQAEFERIHTEQTLVDAKREEAPKITRSKKDLRQVVDVLLAMVHFDVATGNQTLNPVLGHIDEMIDKERAVARSRRTVAKKEAARAAADQAANDQSANAGGDQAANTDPSSGSPSDQNG